MNVSHLCLIDTGALLPLVTFKSSSCCPSCLRFLVFWSLFLCNQSSNRPKPLNPSNVLYCEAALESRLHFTATIMRRIIVSTEYLYVQVSGCFIKLILCFCKRATLS